MTSNIRKKLHEIGGNYHCSIIGTCLTIKQVRKAVSAELSQVRKCKHHAKMRDYAIHSYAVDQASKISPVTKQMNRMLNRNYALAISQFTPAMDDKQIKDLFEQKLKTGEIAGAYWALVSHPSVSSQTMFYAFSEIHMLSHINGYSNRINIKEREELRKMINVLNIEKQQLYKKEEQVRVKLLQKFSAREQALAKGWEAEKQQYEEQVKVLKNGTELKTALEEAERLNTELEKSNRSNYRLTARCQALLERVASLTNEISGIKESERKNESDFPKNNHSKESAVCKSSAKVKLKGKRVLYLGGRGSNKNKCCREVESLGADFLFHDGGVEMSLKTLPAKVRASDLVFCPTDCVSHAACDIAKKECQNCGKKFYYLRSSGTTSLLRELEKIAL